MENKEVVAAAFPMECRGAYPRNLIGQPVVASVTVFWNGVRQIGCPFLSRVEIRARPTQGLPNLEIKNACMAVDQRKVGLYPLPCVHLNPLLQTV